MAHSKKEDFDITCWYLNIRRLAELLEIGPTWFQRDYALDDYFAKAAIAASFKNHLVAYVQKNKIKTIGELILEGKAKPGMLFTSYSTFNCKGILTHFPGSGKKAVPAIAWTKFDEFKKDLKLTIPFHKEHLVSNSAWSAMSGKKQLFTLSLIESVSDTEIIAIPYVFASLITGLSPVSVKGMFWNSKMEIHIENVDNFKAVVSNRLDLKSKHLEILKGIPESDIKLAFHEIIGEPTIQKDWGGERSDLYTTRLSVQGKRVSAAFIFKGPAKFHPMTMADLGKNGDQIPRLLSEDTDLMVLQHCHVITPFVRNTMRAYSASMAMPRLFLVIDGYDTIRILHAYNKCGVREIISGK